MVLELKKIDKSFSHGNSRRYVLQDISYSFEKGRWHTLFGASGSGKTTLLNVAGGLIEPDSGEVVYEGLSVYRMKDRKISRWRNSRIGFVFQFFHLINDIDVRGNIILPVTIAEGNVDEAWFQRLINILKIERMMKRRPSTLSGGEQQRVAMARALIKKPDFVFADEPTGNLDSDNSETVVNLLKEIQEESGVGIVLATHESGLMKIGDVKIEISDGSITESNRS